MKKTPAPPERKTSAPEQGDSRSSPEFLGTDNPRHLRVIQALWVRPISREEVDRVAGCANGPDLISELRCRGLQIPCERQKRLDRDLFACFPGAYALTHRDRRKLAAWKRQLHRNGGRS
jgi:hypothetical protein